MPETIKGFPDYLKRLPSAGRHLNKREQLLFNMLYHAVHWHDQLQKHDIDAMREALNTVLYVEKV